MWTLWFNEKVYLTYIVHLCYVFSFCTFFREIIFTKFFVKLISRKFSFWLPTYFLLFRELSECRPLREQYGCENGIGMFFLFAFSPNIWHAFSQYYLIYIWEKYFVIFKNYLWIYLLTYIMQFPFFSNSSSNLWTPFWPCSTQHFTCKTWINWKKWGIFILILLKDKYNSIFL